MTPEDKIKYSDAMYVYLNFHRRHGGQILRHMSLAVARKRLTELENKYSIIRKQLLENMGITNG